jgi:hypothetical protein
MLHSCSFWNSVCAQQPVAVQEGVLVLPEQIRRRWPRQTMSQMLGADEMEKAVLKIVQFKTNDVGGS